MIANINICGLAQSSLGYTTINGVVKDARTKKKIEYVSIAIPESNIATISNEDGVFSLKIQDTIPVYQLEISCLGYTNLLYSIPKETTDITIYLSPSDQKLKEVTILAMEPLDLVRKAIDKIADNNSSKSNILTGFYRETIKKGRNYINISEAIIDIYKTPYSQSNQNDKLQIYKGRQLLSPKQSDTLIVKFQGGPNISTDLDIVKNRDVILNIETLNHYKYEMDESVMLDDKLHYVVNFQPQVIVAYPLFYGKLYINKENLTFSRAEFSMSMEDRNKVIETILIKKPAKLQFKPEKVMFIIAYKEQNGKSYLSYIRNDVQFKCDWKKRFFFFSTNYTIVSEMVITNRREENVEKISSKIAFDRKNVLSDRLSNFYDSNFWEDYNIIEPTESLESAVNKLKKSNESK